MSNHRADHRGPKRATYPSAAGQTGGRRRALKHAAKSNFRKVPGGPAVIGAAALAIAAVGAISMGPGVNPASANSDVKFSSGSASALSGTDAFSFFSERDSRAQAISRDSQRQALQDAAKVKLKAAAEDQMQQRNAALSNLRNLAEKRATQIAKDLWVLPTVGYHLTARFGMAGGLWANNHTGLDFAAPTGTPIFAVANGVISETGWAGSYGNRTIETLTDGTEIWYAHQSAINVHSGETVTGGETIGAIGSTGNTTGPHVHIEVRPGGGDPVDPYPAFVYHGVTP
ncbi:MAG: Glycyl-glycine endopeptidase precursor [Marmoricola sp.]|nr:Glycyl-glycine endopeptidase precursor [Marmoricola sp.]